MLRKTCRPIKVSRPLLSNSSSSNPYKLIQEAAEVKDTSLVEVRSAGDLGNGVFAAHDIARGTRIISEAPLLVVKPRLGPETLEKHVKKFCAAVWALSARDLETLDDLYRSQSRPNDKTQQVIRQWHEEHGDKQGRKLNTRNLRRATNRTMTRFSIFMINKVRMGGDASCGEGLFTLFSRVNHSCSPNVAKSYNPTIKRLTVHATRDIKKGDQLFTNYADGTLHPKAYRQAWLEQNWGFGCQCRACTNPEEDRLRGQMFELVDSLFLHDDPNHPHPQLEGSEGPPRTVRQALEVHEEIAALLKHPAVDLQSVSLCRM